ALSGSHLATPGSVWVEPDQEDFVNALRQAFADFLAGGGRSAARAVRARHAFLRRLDPLAWADRVARSAIDRLVAPSMPPLRVAWISSWDVACGIAEYSRSLVAAMLDQHDAQMAAPVVLADERTAGSVEEKPVRILPEWQAGVPESLVKLARAVAKEDPDV